MLQGDVNKRKRKQPKFCQEGGIGYVLMRLDREEPKAGRER